MRNMGGGKWLLRATFLRPYLALSKKARKLRPCLAPSKKLENPVPVWLNQALPFLAYAQELE